MYLKVPKIFLLFFYSYIILTFLKYIKLYIICLLIVTYIVICDGLTKYKSSLYFLMTTVHYIIVVVIYLRNENNNYILSN